MAGLPDQFLFINKSVHSRSLSHSNSDERFDIQSHVQSRQKKLEKSCSPLSKSTFVKEVPVRISRLKKEFSSKRKQRGKASDAVPCSDNDIKLQDKVYRPGQLSVGQAAIESNPYSHLSRNSSDPFKTTSVVLDASGHRLLQYPFSGFLENTFKAESLCMDLAGSKDQKFRHHQAMTARLQSCVGDQLAMYATLSYCASCVRWAVGQSESEHPPEYFMLKAISNLRSRLDGRQNLDISLIVAIYALGVSELWAENRDAAVAHLSAVKECVERYGGMSSLEPYIRESIILADK
ncbi:MAG: hypothetical protein Q9227_008128 [Pyrenula ochraceoflavens]